MTQETNTQTGQQASQPVASATPQQGAQVETPQREAGSWVPYDSFPERYRQSGNPQWQHVAHDANQFYEMNNAGAPALLSAAKEAGITAAQMTTLLQQSPELVKSLLDGGQEQTQVDPYAQMQQQYAQQYLQGTPYPQGYQQPYQQPTQPRGDVLTKEAVEKMMEGAIGKLKDQWAKQEEEIGATIEFDDAMNKATKDVLGRDPNPQKYQDLGGRSRELDLDARAIHNEIKDWAYELRDERYQENDPRRKLPPNRDLIAEAGRIVKAHRSAQARVNMETLAEQQQQIPGGAVPAGPAGRPQASPENMSGEERAAEAFRRMQARKAAG